VLREWDLAVLISLSACSVRQPSVPRYRTVNAAWAVPQEIATPTTVVRAPISANHQDFGCCSAIQSAESSWSVSLQTVMFLGSSCNRMSDAFAASAGSPWRALCRYVNAVQNGASPRQKTHRRCVAPPITNRGCVKLVAASSTSKVSWPVNLKCKPEMHHGLGLRNRPRFFC
jgi:hypothetical protein